MLNNFSPKIRQYLVIITVNLSVLGAGFGIAWSSPVLVKLRDEETTVLPLPITETQGSWVVSIGFLCGIFSCMLGIFLLDRIGRKNTILVACVPKTAAVLLLVFANDLWMLLVGRAIIGASDAMIFTSLPIYSSEIASKEIRGGLGTILQIMSSIGVVSMLCIGPFISYLTLNILFAILMVITTLPLLLLPKSPYFLSSKGRNAEAEKVLTFLRGSESQAQEELKELTDQANQQDTSFREIIKLKTFWKSFGLVLVLSVGGQLSGFNSVTFYLQTILESTETSISPELCSVIIGLIQLLASIGTSLVTDKFGRKPILISTLTGLATGMIGLGLFFFLKTDDVVQGFMNYLPLLSLVTVVICYSGGIGSLNWVVSAELFDDRSRGIGLSLIFVIAYVFTFVITKYFAILLIEIGPTATYWWFSLNCWLLLVFIIFLVPETKGKTFAEIQAKLGAKVEKETKDDVVQYT